MASQSSLYVFEKCGKLIFRGIGTKFLLITEPRQTGVDAVLRRIYEIYSDYVMKNPFYQLEMTIRVEEFDRNLAVYAKSIP